MPKPNITKNQLLEKINAILREFSLPPWSETSLGSAASGQCEIVDLVDFRELGPGRVRIKFQIESPGRDETEISLNFGRGLVCVVPYLHINQGEAPEKRWKIGLVKRWPAGTTEWTYELPCGLDPKPGGSDSEIDSPAHRVIASILGNEFRDGLATDQVADLGVFRLRGEYYPARAYLLRARVVQPCRRRHGDGEIVLMEPDKLLPHIRSGLFVNDTLSAAVLYRAMPRLQQ